MAARLKKREQEFPTCHPIEWACSLLLDVCSVHPFLNGNGCLARLCFAYGLARHGIPFPVVFTDSHSKARSHYIPTTSLLCKGRRVKKESHQPKTFMQWELSVLLPSFATWNPTASGTKLTSDNRNVYTFGRVFAICVERSRYAWVHATYGVSDSIYFT
jgi:hypothetical protein